MSGARDRTRPRREATRPESKGAEIVAGLREFLDVLKSGEPLETHFTVHTMPADFTPRPYGPDDVRRVRALLSMSQVIFARFLGVGPGSVRAWEQGLREPSALARRFLDEIEANPAHWRRRLARSLASIPTRGPADV
jgi:putative transcriptional regulator